MWQDREAQYHRFRYSISATVSSKGYGFVCLPLGGRWREA